MKGNVPGRGSSYAPAREKQIVLAAEEQLAFGRFLADVLNARDKLKAAHPESLLLELVEAKIKRMQLVGEAAMPL